MPEHVRGALDEGVLETPQGGAVVVGARELDTFSMPSKLFIRASGRGPQAVAKNRVWLQLPASSSDGVEAHADSTVS